MVVVAGDAVGDLLAAVSDELAQAPGGDRRQEGDARRRHVRVRKVEVVLDAPAHGFPLVRSEARATDEVERELLAHGVGGAGDDLVAGRPGDGGDVLARRRQLQREQ